MVKKIIIILCLLFIIKSSFSQTELTKVSEKAEQLYKSRKYQETIAYCDKELRAFKPQTTQDSIDYSNLYYSKGKSLFYLKEYDKSTETYKNGIPYTPSNEEGIEQKGIFFYEISFSEYYLGKELNSFRAMQKAITVLESMENPNLDFLIGAYNDNAKSSATLGYIDYALNTNTKALRLYNQNKKEVDSLTVNNYELILNRSRAYIIKKRIDNTQYDEGDSKLLFEVVKNIEKYINKRNTMLNSRDRLYVADIYFRYADHFLVRNAPNTSEEEIDSALYYLDKAINHIDKDKYPGNLLAFQFSVCKARKKKKEYKKALDAINSLLLKADTSSFNYSAFLAFKIGLLVEMGNWSEAKSLLFHFVESTHDSEEKLKNDFSNFIPMEKLSNVGLLLDTHDFFEYISTNDSLYQQKNLLSILALKQLKFCHRQPNFNPKIKNYYLRSVLNQMQELNTIERNKDSIICELINDTENIENRLAWQQFNQSRDVVQLPVIDSLEQVEFQLRKQLVKAKKQRKSNQQDSLQRVLDKHKHSLEESYPTLARFNQDNFDIRQFQQQVRPNEAVLKYLFFDNQFAVFTITKDSIQWQLQPWGEVEQKQLSHHLKVIKDPLADLSIDQHLTDLLIPKAALSYDIITVVPDTPVYPLPFETLIYNGAYLTNQKAIRYSSHLRFAFYESEGTKENKPKITIFAPEYPQGDNQYATRSVPYYLEGAQQEAKQISKLFTASSFIGKDATKSIFIENKNAGNILHMAMHATIDEDNPSFSHFNFPNEEQLHVEELYGLNIPANLAVLSACNTGVGKTDGASSMASLQRAFTFAGTKATVASLWEVPDQTTSEIMIGFYRYLKQGKTKSEALQLSKKDYLKNTTDKALIHPYYWAGFVLYGEDIPVVNVSNNYWWFVLVVVIVLLLFYLKKNKRD